MNEFFPVIFISLGVILVIGLIILGIIQAARRRKELQQWAQSNGYRFNPDSDYSLDNRLGEFSCLRHGSNRYGYNFVEGTHNNRNFTAFDYHYETYSTDSKGRRKTHHHRFSSVILKTDLPMKPLFIRPEGFFDKITEFFGFDDIDFESAEFSRNFYVKSSDKRWAYDVIHQETMEFLLSAQRFTLDFQGYNIMAYRNRTFSIKDFENALFVIEGILDRLPDYLLRELKGEH